MNIDQLEQFIENMKARQELITKESKRMDNDFKILMLKIKLGIKDDLKIIDGFENYAISDKGKVYNIKFKQELKLNFRDRYIFVGLLNKKGQKSFMVSRLVAMHFLENPENKPCVDHINNDKFNNDVKNLRWSTNSENNRNRTKTKSKTSSIYKGVNIVFNKKNIPKYNAYIRIDKIKNHLGSFKTEEEAARKYDENAKIYFGEYAKCNFN